MTSPPAIPPTAFSIMRAQELATATATVLSARAAMIRVALADPANANHAELERMVVEKAQAVTEIGRLSWLAWASVASTAMNAWTSQARIGAAYASAVAGARTPFDLVAAEAPLRPLHRRLAANGKRLSAG
ncbi:MAG: hypothetical protein HY060_00640 [Proteobacteria bacterium]|nr:hypothetical protein [Pseudomonadota bacterium]